MSVCSINTEIFQDLHDRLRQQAMAHNTRIASLGTLELTPYCNMKCQHCYVTQCQHAGTLLNTEEWLRIIDEIADESCIWLLLTGGEPLLRPDFLDIYTYAKNKGLFTNVFTNGTLITKDIAKYFQELPPFEIEISIYGATKETYENVTGVPGSFEKCIQGIDLLLQHDVHFSLKTMLISTNKHEYWDMKKMAQDYGVDFRMDPVLNPALDGSHEICKYRLSPEEIVQLDMDDPERRENWERWASRYNDIPDACDMDTVFTCGAGLGQFHIDGFGNLQMCTIARQPGYNLREGSFRDGWLGLITNLRNQKMSHVSRCRQCQIRRACPICPGWAYLEHGTLEEQPIDYLCEIARLRSERFLLEKTTSK